jgi:hydrogenase maturation protease
MDLRAVEQIANAVMYEGYMLYPYRRSAVKNQQRFNFGVLYPREYCDLQLGAEAWEMQTECLATGTPSSTIEVKTRFLQMSSTPEGWQEGIEREVCADPHTFNSIGSKQRFVFECPSGTLEGELELRASPLGDNLFKLTLNVRNLARLQGADSENAADVDRDRMLLQSLVSVHSIFRVAGGEFISLLDPPDQFKAAVAGCRNVGTWPVLAGPVLAGEEGQRNLLLSAPIILYDYPQIAAESAGDLFDGTEIDEILALRILTMTDDEKLEVRSGDDRARRILERTEMLPLEHFQKLHGALRGLAPVSKERE